MNRKERRALARRIVKSSPGLLEKVADEEGVSRGRAKQLATSYIASGLAAQQAGVTFAPPDPAPGIAAIGQPKRGILRRRKETP